MDEQTIRAYDEQAEKYDNETVDFWKDFPRTIIDEFARLTNRGKVIDIGSGPGRDGVILKESGCDVVCIDASETMVRLSSERGLRSIVGDLLRLPFPDAIFDGAWAYTSLLHIPKRDINAALGEVVRVLKDGGIFGLGLIEGDTEEYRVTSKVTAPRLFSYYTKEEIEHLLALSGFTILYFEQFTPGKRNYLNFIAKKQ